MKFECKITISKFCVRWMGTSGVMLLMLQTGIMAGWTSPNMAKLTAENATIHLTLSEASWVASSLNFGRFIGAMIIPFFVEFLGSKKTVFFLFFPTSISWILLMMASSAEWFIAARVIGGITFGMTLGCFSLYLGEVSVPSVRGTLIALAMCGAPLGSVIGTVCETYLSTITSNLIYLVQCLVGIILFLWLPDSPYHLVKTNNVDGAKKSIAWYYGEDQVDKEFSEIKTFVDSNAGQSIRSKLQEFKNRQIQKIMIIVIILFIFPQMCGLFNLLFYMEIILKKGKSFLIDPQQFVVYANIIAFVSTFAATKLIDRLGRRFLFIVSSIGTTTAMVGLGLHFYLLNSNVDPQKLQWLPIGSITAFMITFYMGFMTVPSTVLSELFPANIKSVAACLATLTASLFGFISAKSYQPMVDAVGETYTFWIHAVFSALALPCALFLLPETKGKSFQEIQDKIYKRRSGT